MLLSHSDHFQPANQQKGVCSKAVKDWALLVKLTFFRSSEIARVKDAVGVQGSGFRAIFGVDTFHLVGSASINYLFYGGPFSSYKHLLHKVIL